MICLNITLRVPRSLVQLFYPVQKPGIPIAIFKSCVKENNDSNITCRYEQVLSLYQTSSECDGSRVVSIKQNVNFKFQLPAIFIFLDFCKSGFIKSCSSSEDLSAHTIQWSHVDWWKFCTHLRSLNIHHPLRWKQASSDKNVSFGHRHELSAEPVTKMHSSLVIAFFNYFNMLFYMAVDVMFYSLSEMHVGLRVYRVRHNNRDAKLFFVCVCVCFGRTRWWQQWRDFVIRQRLRIFLFYRTYVLLRIWTCILHLVNMLRHNCLAWRATASLRRLQQHKDPALDCYYPLKNKI
jgi:hypothetical protein